ncbi:YqjF family protein [Cohnella yongneupensis]|uniref:YqjF family protein n=1 Tax=Cohnella yongneupensis TaxID=425006 RepID=A0ABW0R1S9_9BACL
MKTDHRPWPIPRKPWRMKQTWNRLLFASWPIEPEAIKPFLPNKLRLDTYEGRAWVSIVPFDITGIRMRYLPPIPLTTAFAELNVRTYVTLDDKPGIYLFSLDATNLLAVLGARTLYHLPYYWADIDVIQEEDRIRYISERRNAGGFVFRGTYKPVSPAFRAQQGTLDYWLAERYCLYATRKNDVYRCDILHEPWALHYAEARIYENTMVDGIGFKLPDEEPLLHYSERQEVVMWGLEKLRI